MPDYGDIASRLHDYPIEIRSAANDLIDLIKNRGVTGLDLKMGLDRIKHPVTKLIELRETYPKEVRRQVPHFGPELREAYEAVSRASTVVDSQTRQDLFRLAEEINNLLRSVDELSRPR